MSFAADTWFVAAGIDGDDVWTRYRDALPADHIVVCRLRAAAATLRERILDRGGPLVRFVDDAVGEARALDALSFPDVVVDTSGEPVSASVSRVLGVSGIGSTR